MSTAAHFTFGMCQQLPTDASVPAVAPDPQIADPFIPRHRDADDLFS